MWSVGSSRGKKKKVTPKGSQQPGKKGEDSQARKKTPSKISTEIRRKGGEWESPAKRAGGRERELGAG